jgi:hypothetical protein
MSKRIVIIVSITSTLAATFLWWATRRSHSPVAKDSERTPTPAVSSTTAGPKPSMFFHSTNDGWPEMPYQGMSDPRWPEVDRREKLDPSWEWKMPINFFGKVVDQDRRPVAGANIEFNWNDLSNEGTSYGKAVSDTQGMFALTKRNGKCLQVTVKKDGYYTPKQAHLRGFEYADFSQADYYKPDPDKPVIFQLRKKGAGEPLVMGRASIHVPADGTPVRVDLLNKGRLSPDGQLEISALTNTEKYPPRIFDWRAMIAVRGGGLLEHNDEFPFTAPEAGYAPEATFDFPAEAAGWKRVVHKSYYMTFGSPPKYGRIEIDLNGGSQVVHIRYWINPSGSRNLEYDPKMPAASP